MKLKVFDDTNRKNKASFFKMGDFMTIKNHFFKDEKNGHLE